jgi:hypothetical protein
MAQVCAYRQVGQNHLHTPTGYNLDVGETPIHQAAVAIAQANTDNDDNTGAVAMARARSDDLEG